MSNSIDTLFDELTSFTLPVTPPKPAVLENNITDDNINEYIIKRTGHLIDTGINAIEDIKDYIVQGQNPDEIAALSELISSTTKAIEAMNRINLLNKKSKHDKELKEMDLQNRKEVAGMLPGNNVVNNTNLLIASREEILKQLLDTTENVIEAKLVTDDTTVVSQETH